MIKFCVIQFFDDKCALGANKNKVVKVSVNPDNDGINLTVIFDNEHLTDSQTMVRSQILVYSATGSGNEKWINPQDDTAFKSSVDSLPVGQDDEAKL